MTLDRVFALHAHDDDHCENINHRGKIGAGTLSIHSFLDGLAVGLARQITCRLLRLRGLDRQLLITAQQQTQLIPALQTERLVY